MKYLNKFSQKNIFEEKDNGILIHIKVIPNAKTEAFTKENDFLRLKITAQAIENKANKAIIDFFSKQLKISKSRISITKGVKSKEKSIFIQDTTLKEINSTFNFS